MDSEWHDLLNPDITRARFAQAGLFLIAHELLISSIKDKLHDFFGDTWEPKNGWKTSSSYREKVLSLDPKPKRKGQESPMRASIAWLRQYDVITERDEALIHELSEERNRLAHELRRVLTGSYTQDFDGLFPKIVSLIEKIDRWWVVNVDMGTDPEWQGEEFDPESVVPGSVILLRMLETISLGTDADAWELYRSYKSK